MRKHPLELWSNMKDKVVLITGAKGGLGSFITQRFLTAGATVIGTSRSISNEDFPHPNFTSLPVDFTKSTAVRGAAESVIDRFARLDILVHVLGGFAGGQTVSETDDATWEQMRDLNLTAAFYVLRAAIPHLRKSGKGRIVAIGSSLGFRILIFPGSVAFWPLLLRRWTGRKSEPPEERNPHR